MSEIAIYTVASGAVEVRLEKKIAGSNKPVRFYNLNVTIFVGYRVKLPEGVRFRQWATVVLRQHPAQRRLQVACLCYGLNPAVNDRIQHKLAARADECKKLERLCRYISRPAVSKKRLSLAPNGYVRYQLKTPDRDGTTHVIFEPLDFMAKLAALLPKPRVNLTRFHGVCAPNSKHRALVTPAKRGKGNKHSDTEQE